MEYVKNIIQDFDWQLHLRNLSEEIEIMFQIINDQVNKVGDIELSYSMSDVWDMVRNLKCQVLMILNYLISPMLSLY